MCNIENIILTMIGIFLISFIIFTTIIIVSNNKHKKRIETITLYQINTTSIIDSSIPQILDLIIDDSFRDYQIKSLAINNEFISEEKEILIRSELVALVTNRISNATLDKLSLFYNISNIADIIADKIYITVMNYVVEQNMTNGYK